jgi:hypothetical protein
LTVGKRAKDPAQSNKKGPAAGGKVSQSTTTVDFFAPQNVIPNTLPSSAHLATFKSADDKHKVISHSTSDKSDPTTTKEPSKEEDPAIPQIKKRKSLKMQLKSLFISAQVKSPSQETGYSLQVCTPAMQYHVSTKLYLLSKRWTPNA